MQMIIVNIVLAFKILSKNTNSHYKHKYCSIFKYSVDKKMDDYIRHAKILQWFPSCEIFFTKYPPKCFNACARYPRPVLLVHDI